MQHLQHAKVYGFSYRKLSILKAFQPHIRFKKLSRFSRLHVGETVFVWGMTPVPENLENKNTIIRVEDGFLRSAGLGAAFYAPISWVFDVRGMYFNTESASGLEEILNDYVFSESQLALARRVQQKIIQFELSKYNLKSLEPILFPETDQLKILVIGQVEGDASIQFGSPVLKTNLALLQQVRQRYPEGFIVYRPHPDVVAGWRKDGLDHEAAQKIADQIQTKGNITDWLNWADEVQVMTSLAGFEALLRGKHVVCYGLPFYSGWGLTQDVLSSLRPKRTLSIEQLVAATLIVYPSYRSILDAKTFSIDIEQAIAELKHLKAKKQSNWLKWLRPFMKY